MNVTITYIYHNCFILKTKTRAYLFDYPCKSHLPVGAEALVREAVSGTDLTVFISHSHDDHCNEDLVTMVSSAQCVDYIISDDVVEMKPEAIPAEGVIQIVEPDERYQRAGMTVETLMSNDLGVAFLVQDGDLRFYYGGDLAKWIWKTASSSEREFTTSFFRDAMERVRDFSPHVAFSNVDKRLENLAGGVEAYRQTGAKIFVPMHTFGDTSWLDSFRETVGEVFTRLFIYSQPGDSAEFDV
jgi:L-ascorbate metabolism protein UlaG (beta-lactamase superfamily)